MSQIKGNIWHAPLATPEQADALRASMLVRTGPPPGVRALFVALAERLDRAAEAHEAAARAARELARSSRALVDA